MTSVREPKITNQGKRYHRASLIEPSHSGYVHITAQINERLRLFNHFFAEDTNALDVWDYVADWYQQEMRLTNSEVLAPIDPDSTPFASINHASWNMSLPGFISRQLSRPSFRTFVLAYLRGNDIGSLPYLYRHHNGAG